MTCGEVFAGEFSTCPACRKKKNDGYNPSVSAEYRKTDEYRLWAKKYKEKRKCDIQVKLRRTLRSRIYQATKKCKKSGSSVKDLGCSIDFFKQYIERLFLPNMSWDNHGNGIGRWNIDHIIPLSSVDLSEREQFLKVCHYTNLQPLWYMDNLRKGDGV